MTSKFARHLVFVSVLAIASAGILTAQTRTIDEKPDKETERKTVTLIVDYGDGAEKHLKFIPWRKSMTVASIMEYAVKHRHGIKVKTRGSGSTAFIEQIDDLKNQGGRGRNWVFRINKELGKKSYAVSKLNPNDTVLWKFDTYP